MHKLSQFHKSNQSLSKLSILPTKTPRFLKLHLSTIKRRLCLYTKTKAWRTWSIVILLSVFVTCQNVCNMVVYVRLSAPITLRFTLPSVWQPIVPEFPILPIPTYRITIAESYWRYLLPGHPWR